MLISKKHWTAVVIGLAVSALAGNADARGFGGGTRVSNSGYSRPASFSSPNRISANNVSSTLKTATQTSLPSNPSPASINPALGKVSATNLNPVLKLGATSSGNPSPASTNPALGKVSATNVNAVLKLGATSSGNPSPASINPALGKASATNLNAVLKLGATNSGKPVSQVGTNLPQKGGVVGAAWATGTGGSPGTSGDPPSSPSPNSTSISQSTSKSTSSGINIGGFGGGDDGGSSGGGDFGGGSYAPTDSPLPANPTSTEMETVRIVNPADTTVTLSFSVAGRTYNLAAGKVQELNVAPNTVIEFDRANHGASGRYTLAAGNYLFGATPNGWELYHMQDELAANRPVPVH